MTLTKQLLSDSRNERVEGRFICDGGVIQLFGSDPFISADDPVMTVDEWFGKWLAESCINLKISTIALYREYMDNHVIPYFAGMRLDEVNDTVIQDFINLKSDLSPATVRSLATFLKSGFKAAWERGIIEPLTWRVTLPKKTKKHLRVFSKTEQKALEDAVRASSNPNYIGILICLYTGLRVGELCALRWEDINFMNGTLTVNRTIKRIKDIKKDNGTKLVILSPKSAASQRTIPIPAFFLDELRGYKERIGANSGYVLNKDGEPVEPRTYQYQFERILKDTGIEKAKFHTLRHTFSTRALEIGFDIKTLSEILGHSSADTTLKMYAHSLDEHKRYSMNLLQNIYSD